MLAKLINDILTEKDGNSFCPVRLCGVLGFIFYFILALIEMLKHCHDFDLLQCASGMAVILGVLAGGVSVKQKGES